VDHRSSSTTRYSNVTEGVIEALREHGVLPPAVLHRRVAAAALGAAVGVPAQA